MGCNAYWGCRTCRVWKHCGYGSYFHFDDRVSKNTPKGHTDHDTFTWTGDAEWGWSDGALYYMGPYGVKGAEIIGPEWKESPDE